MWASQETIMGGIQMHIDVTPPVVCQSIPNRGEKSGDAQGTVYPL